jgi:hypothetical protein
MIGLPLTYRFKVLNGCGQTIAINSIFLYARRTKVGSDGFLSFESSEATLLSSGSTLSSGSYLAGTTQDNSSNKYLGGDFSFVVTAPASASGDVTLYFERSTDGTNFDDAGLGDVVAILNFTTSGTKRISFSL